ncbi:MULTISPECIES: DUF4176 domain-containing protein [Streptococcus]|uniref:DUF4176 domain-containing protein n=1 Tax=Streptococcus pantholopis TaxID=1811193 RepID=A0A172Q513_9STRE|nr:DUF4176 domain-containing protein [Streptococcus pantholopis]AND78545.1 hypothetical protein A0O21_00170 [Streptococcus pantholopis]
MLPIGSVVYLKEGNQKLMILNRAPLLTVNGMQKYVDYSACEFPKGLVPEEVYYFNEEDIDKVIYMGLQDEDEKRFEELYNVWRKENETRIPQAKIVKNSSGNIELQ